MATKKIQVRQDTAANWAAANPILSVGEMGLDKTEAAFKIGDGLTSWNNLPFATPRRKEYLLTDSLEVRGQLYFTWENYNQEENGFFPVFVPYIDSEIILYSALCFKAKQDIQFGDVLVKMGTVFKYDEMYPSHFYPNGRRIPLYRMEDEAGMFGADYAARIIPSEESITINQTQADAEKWQMVFIEVYL